MEVAREAYSLLPFLKLRKAPAKRLPGESKAAKRERRRAEIPARRQKVYAAVDKRSGCCEEDNGVIMCLSDDRLEHDHFWGRGKVKETVRNVWRLCKWHHDQKTANDPDRATWIRRFRHHCLNYRYMDEVAKCDRALALEEAQHPGAVARETEGGKP
jgi:hypothetical protein